MSFLWLLYAWKLGTMGLCAPIHLPTLVPGLSDSTGCGNNPKSILACWTDTYRVCLKCLDKFQEWVQTRKEVQINICPQTISFRGTDEQRVDLIPIDIYLWEHLKTALYSPPIENEGTLHQCIFDTCQNIHNHPGTFERVRQLWSDMSVRALV